MDQEKKDLGKWWMWILLMIAFTGAVFTALKIGGVASERVIFTNSYQKAAGDKKQLATWRAQRASIESQLVSDPLNSSLVAQKRMLDIQIASMTSN